MSEETKSSTEEPTGESTEKDNEKPTTGVRCDFIFEDGKQCEYIAKNRGALNLHKYNAHGMRKKKKEIAVEGEGGGVYKEETDANFILRQVLDSHPDINNKHTEEIMSWANLRGQLHPYEVAHLLSNLKGITPQTSNIVGQKYAAALQKAAQEGKANVQIMSLLGQPGGQQQGQPPFFGPMGYNQPGPPMGYMHPWQPWQQSYTPQPGFQQYPPQMHQPGQQPQQPERGEKTFTAEEVQEMIKRRDAERDAQLQRQQEMSQLRAENQALQQQIAQLAESIRNPPKSTEEIIEKVAEKLKPRDDVVTMKDVESIVDRVQKDNIIERLNEELKRSQLGMQQMSEEYKRALQNVRVGEYHSDDAKLVAQGLTDLTRVGEEVAKEGRATRRFMMTHGLPLLLGKPPIEEHPPEYPGREDAEQAFLDYMREEEERARAK